MKKIIAVYAHFSLTTPGKKRAAIRAYGGRRRLFFALPRRPTGAAFFVFPPPPDLRAFSRRAFAFSAARTIGILSEFCRPAFAIFILTNARKRYRIKMILREARAARKTGKEGDR